MLTLYALTWSGVIAAQLAPGPNLAAVASIGLAQGRRPALFTVTGIATGMLFWSLATSLGLGALLETFPKALFLLKIFGGGYLLFLALKSARTLIRGQGGTNIAPASRTFTDRAAWNRGMLVVLTNPKAALMWAAVASFLFGQGFNAAQVLAFGPMGALSGLIVYGTYAWLFSTGLAMRSYSRFAKWIEALFATAFGTMGISLLWSGLRDIQL